MNIQPLDQPIEKAKADLAVVMLTKEEVTKWSPTTDWKKNASVPMQSKDFTGELGSLAVLYTTGIPAKRMLLVGLGEEKKRTLESVRKASAVGIQVAKSMKTEQIAFDLPRMSANAGDVAAAITEGIVLGNYTFDKYKTKEKDQKEIKHVFVLGSGKDVASSIHAAMQICDNVNLVRNLANENADEATAVNLANTAAKIAKEAGLTCTIFDEKKIKSLGMNLLLAVNQGSAVPARFVILEYKGDPKSKKTLALVGKGITFDSGGLNLKPTGSLENMKEDMTGAALVLATLKTCAELGIKKNVIGVMPFTENAVGSRAYKPGDIFKSYAGKTVEIGNTDAEGRLILADALSYTARVLKPDAIIDVATLTGMVQYTFAEVVIGLMTNNSDLAQKVKNAGEKTFERVWELPLYEEYKEHTKSDFADLRSTTKMKYAGTITAASFLEEFIEGLPWVHLDIAGVSWSDKGRYYTPTGCTGAGLRLLVDVVQRF